MLIDRPPPPPPSTAPPSRPRFLCGFLLSTLALLLAAEAALRLFPPDDLTPYVTESTSLAGIYKPDPTLAVDYASFADFQQQYAPRLAALGPLDSHQPTWLWLGNSFVQAPNMLGDTAQAALPATRMFYLQRNEMPYLRLAQARLLLTHGLHPQRLLFSLVPVDSVGIAQQPLSSLAVSPHGAIARRLPTLNALADPLLAHSRIALFTWIRHNHQAANRLRAAQSVTTTVPPFLHHDFQTYITFLAALAHDHSTTATVLLIPNREQLYGQSPYAFQDDLAALCRQSHLDCFDARHAFDTVPDKSTLLLPDFHLTPRANHLLLTALLAHLQSTTTTPSTQQAPP